MLSEGMWHKAWARISRQHWSLELLFNFTQFLHQTLCTKFAFLLNRLWVFLLRSRCFSWKWVHNGITAAVQRHLNGSIQYVARKRSVGIASTVKLKLFFHFFILWFVFGLHLFDWFVHLLRLDCFKDSSQGRKGQHGGVRHPSRNAAVSLNLRCLQFFVLVIHEFAHSIRNVLQMLLLRMFGWLALTVSCLFFHSAWLCRATVKQQFQNEGRSVLQTGELLLEKYFRDLVVQRLVFSLDQVVSTRKHQSQGLHKGMSEQFVIYKQLLTHAAVFLSTCLRLLQSLPKLWFVFFVML